MKKLFVFLLCAQVISVSASNKKAFVEKGNSSSEINKAPAVSFDVKLKKSKFRVGEKVEFELERAPNSIDFFSGEAGHEYNSKGVNKKASGMTLNFSIRFHSSTAQWPQDITWNPISLLVSTDFTGDYTFAGIKKAKWVDITNRVKFPDKRGFTAPVGPIDLSDLTVVGKPFYFAIKYVNVPGRPQYMIQTPEWYSVLPGGKELIGRIRSSSKSGVEGGENTMGFQIVDENPKRKAEIKYVTGDPRYDDRFTIVGNKSAENAQTWIVSKGFDGVKEVMAKANSPVYIKSLINSSVAKHSHIYSAPGTYEVSFVSTTVDTNGKKNNEVKSLTVVVE